MGENERLTREMVDAGLERGRQCRAALDKLERVREAILAVQRCEPGAVARLKDLCEERYYGGLVPDVRCEKIVAAARARDEAVSRLADAGEDDDLCELKA